jgi:hypothetical protein
MDIFWPSNQNYEGVNIGLNIFSEYINIFSDTEYSWIVFFNMRYKYKNGIIHGTPDIQLDNSVKYYIWIVLLDIHYVRTASRRWISARKR